MAKEGERGWVYIYLEGVNAGIEREGERERFEGSKTACASVGLKKGWRRSDDNQRSSPLLTWHTFPSRIPLRLHLLECFYINIYYITCYSTLPLF